MVERVRRVVLHTTAARDGPAAPFGMVARRAADGTLLELWLKNGAKFAEYHRLLSDASDQSDGFF